MKEYYIYADGEYHSVAVSKKDAEYEIEMMKEIDAERGEHYEYTIEEAKTEPLIIVCWKHIYRVRPYTTRYIFGEGLCIHLQCCDEDCYGEPFGNLTVNIQGKTCEKDEAYVDTNNMPNAEQFIKEYRLGKPTGKTAKSGYCTYPLYKFDMEQIAKYAI